MPQTSQPAGSDMPPQGPTVVPGQATVVSGAIPAESLFKGRLEIRIQHKGDLYHLRITRNDKLILTK